ncbi:MAG: histidinol dehydrogenase [Thermoleophilaceae bacterium]
MRISELGPDTTAAQLRALAPDPRDVEDAVREIVGRVRDGGDAAVVELTRRFDAAEVASSRLRVDPAEIDASVALLEPDVLAALRTAIANVRAVVVAQLRKATEVELPEGQRIEIAELPVRRAAAYVPAGRAAYPSTLVMVAITAQSAGVEQVVACAPPGPEGRANPVILAACALCGVDEVYRMGGAQSIAALAFGTETVEAVDVIAGPGSRWVQEAKRQVSGTVGIDGIAGPSELVVVADGAQDAHAIALDLLAQAEHGDDGIVCLITPDRALVAAVRGQLEQLAAQRPSVADPPVALVKARDPESAVALADAVAPEHLELVGPRSEAMAERVRAAGCLFVGPASATAFGDYVAGSNHVLPTGGAARFQSALSAATFTRRMARVTISAEAARRLAPAGATLARAEGFPVHAESMERRA